MKTTFSHLKFPALRVSALLVALAFIVMSHTPIAASRHTALADLPQAAQSLVSRTLGHDDVLYQLQPTAEGFRAANATDTLRADFSKQGIQIAVEDSQWALALQSIGYGHDVQAVGAVAPTASANRLAYTHDTFTEWYANGPAGLEQGWTLNEPPTSRHDESLTLALELHGDARVDADGNSIALLRADGTVAVHYTGLSAYDATGRELRTWFELSGGRVTSSLQIRVDDTNAQYPLTIDPYLRQATLTNSGGANSDLLGVSVAISADGSTIVAGADGVSSNKGAAYVFVKSGSWATTASPTATLTNANGTTGDALGISVAISADGSIIVAGAKVVSAVYVFVKPGGGWIDSSSPTATLTNSGGTTSDDLGASVAISADGSIIVAGAYAVSSAKGAVYVFVKSGNWASTGTPTATLTNSGGTAFDYLGVSAAISADGSTIVAGASGVSSQQGAVDVFVTSGSWISTTMPTAILTNAGGAANDFLGHSVALSADGSTIVAGADGVSSSAGAAYVFVKSGSWATTATPTATLTNGNGTSGDALGYRVAISADGSTIVAGAYGVSGNKGAVDVFVRSSSWATTATPAATLSNSGGAANDYWGYAVAIRADGSTLVVGAYGVSTNRGAAYVFGPAMQLYLPLIMK